MNEEQIIKLASQYLRENNQIHKLVFAVNKNFFFDVNTDEGIYKVKQVDKTPGEKYSTVDVEGIFTVKKYNNPSATEVSPPADEESDYIDIDELSLNAPDDSVVLEEDSSDDEQTQNCVKIEKNKPATLEKTYVNTKNQILETYPNCSQEQYEKIFNHQMKYNHWLGYLKNIIFLEKRKLKKYQKEYSENNVNIDGYDDVQKSAFRLYQNLESKSMTQDQFISEMENNFVDLHRKRIQSRIDGFDNLLLNSLETLSLRKPALTSDSETLKKDFSILKNRGLLDYLLRDQNKETKSKDKLL